MEEKYERIRDQEKLAYINDDWKGQTAHFVVNVLRKRYKPNTVIDIGCGSGVYTQEFGRFSYVLAVDGNPEAKPPKLADLRELHDFGKHDLVFCVEVAEHIQPKYVDTFIQNIVGSAKQWIVFTAAPPKGGDRSEYTKSAHHNEQPREYWIQKFREHGAEYSEKESKELQDIYQGDTNVPTWFRHNLMIFYVRNDRK